LTYHLKHVDHLFERVFSQEHVRESG
jgi:hypothetical protein